MKVLPAGKWSNRIITWNTSPYYYLWISSFGTRFLPSLRPVLLQMRSKLHHTLEMWTGPFVLQKSPRKEASFQVSNDNVQQAGSFQCFYCRQRVLKLKLSRSFRFRFSQVNNIFIRQPNNLDGLFSAWNRRSLQIEYIFCRHGKILSAIQLRHTCLNLKVQMLYDRAENTAVIFTMRMETNKACEYREVLSFNLLLSWFRVSICNLQAEFQMRKEI